MFTKKPNPMEELREMAALIEEQRGKENTEILRRGWCVSQAMYCDTEDPELIIRIAKRIYQYVYEPKT